MFTADPLVGLQPALLASAAGRLARSVVSRPAVVARRGASLATRLGRVAVGTSDVAPERGDRRFTDDAWRDNPVFRRIGQGYLATREEVYRLIDEVDLDDKSAKRAQFAVGIAVEVLSPTNSLANPVVLREARDTNGRSLVAGARNFVDDVQHNGAMPSMVDTTPFSVGENVAVTPGRVVHRSEVLELIQYEPVTDQVHERPMLFVPPQINKFYILDIGPGKSMVEHMVANGQQVFVVSWRNPTPAQREWDLDHYVQSLLDAIDVMREITGSDDVNITGACAGGITTAALLGHLTAIESDAVNAATFLVTVLDTQGESAVSPFVTKATIAAAIRRSQRKGVLEGSELARVFAWLRPNDLVCNYWVNNWLMGNDPPAFDILAWNGDVTNLPASLHADFLAFNRTNPFVNPGALEVLGTPIDLRAFTGDTYVVAGLTDHITPWQSCQRTVELVGGETEFVLSSSGHIQALVNPPGRKKSRYFVSGGQDDGAPEIDGATAETGGATAETGVAGRPAQTDAEAWLAGAAEQNGTWWDHWVAWLSSRSGSMVDAPATVGSDTNPPGDLAPGRYVHNL